VGIDINEEGVLFSAANSDAAVLAKREYLFSSHTEKISSAEAVLTWGITSSTPFGGQ
jgi:hypothetical protein